MTAVDKPIRPAEERLGLLLYAEACRTVDLEVGDHEDPVTWTEWDELLVESERAEYVDRARHWLEIEGLREVLVGFAPTEKDAVRRMRSIADHVEALAHELDELIPS